MAGGSSLLAGIQDLLVPGFGFDKINFFFNPNPAPSRNALIMGINPLLIGDLFGPPSVGKDSVIGNVVAEELLEKVRRCVMRRIFAESELDCAGSRSD